MKRISSYLLIVNLLFSVQIFAAPVQQFENELEVSTQTIHDQRISDTDTWIDGNYVLMFVTNRGSFAYDQGGTLGKNDGFYFPYFGLNDIQNGTATKTLVFAAGIWIAGVDSATGDTLVSVSEYSDDYFPGPMAGGTFIPGADSDPLYHVYKLYEDSMAGNPNQDYLTWPAAMGAPTDSLGNPLLIGDQTLWCVYNDANPSIHFNDASTNVGLGVEIQQTVWAYNEPGNLILPNPTFIGVEQIGSSGIEVSVEIDNEQNLTSHNYNVTTSNDTLLGPVWFLIDVTTGDTLLANQTDFYGTSATVTDGFIVRVTNGSGKFEAFEVVANANGPINPPQPGALGFQSFPSGWPDAGQQVGDGLWAIHTGDSQPNGSRGSYESFLFRVLRAQNNFGANLGTDDLEWRFTGSNDNPGVGGGYAWEAFDIGQAIWVPFELWNIGSGTPNDTTDDVRLLPWIIDNGRTGTFDLESWGDINTAPTGYVIGDPATEHSASGGINDPFTDLVYWFKPESDSPGDAGYQEFEDSILADPINYSGPGTELLARTVLINWNGGEQPPFTQDMPEIGTVFRIRTFNTVVEDTFQFTASLPPLITHGPDAVALYSKYKLINKSSNTYNDFFISLWFDPDIGDAGDDFVGCDTLQDIFFCYNDGADSDYGDDAPAFGGKLIQGPVVKSPNKTAIADGVTKSGYANVGMYSFMKFFQSTDPHSFRWTYQYMNGLDATSNGAPLANGSRYAVPGDPVTGTGDLDNNSSDRRMFATFGPLEFAPNDTQVIVFKLAAGQGTSTLNSITELKSNLNHVIPSAEDSCCVGIRGDVNGDTFDANILDINYFVNYIFRSGPPPPCNAEADVNEDGMPPNLLDLNFLVNFIFRGQSPPGICFP